MQFTVTYVCLSTDNWIKKIERERDNVILIGKELRKKEKCNAN